MTDILHPNISGLCIKYCLIHRVRPYIVIPSSKIQALPCSLKLIEGSTDLKADYTMGVLVGHFNILYEAFNNMAAAGTEQIPTKHLLQY